MESIRGATPEHGHLILRQRGERIGIWHLREDEWHRKPWTRSVTEAYAALQEARDPKPRSRVPDGMALALAAVSLGALWIVG